MCLIYIYIYIYSFIYIFLGIYNFMCIYIYIHLFTYFMCFVMSWLLYMFRFVPFALYVSWRHGRFKSWFLQCCFEILDFFMSVFWAPCLAPILFATCWRNIPIYCFCLLLRVCALPAYVWTLLFCFLTCFLSYRVKLRATRWFSSPSNTCLYSSAGRACAS